MKFSVKSLMFEIEEREKRALYHIRYRTLLGHYRKLKKVMRYVTQRRICTSNNYRVIQEELHKERPIVNGAPVYVNAPYNGPLFVSLSDIRKCYRLLIKKHK